VSEKAFMKIRSTMMRPRNHFARVMAALLGAAALALAGGCASYVKAARAESYLARGQEALEAGRLSTARQFFSKARRERPSADVIGRIGLAYEMGQRCSEAIPYLRSSLRKQPRQPMQVRLALIDCLSRAGRHAEAEKVLAGALRPHFDDPFALNNLAYTCADHGLYVGTALKLLHRAVRLRPNDGMIIDSLGWAQYKLARQQSGGLGRLQDAARNLGRAAGLRPDAEILYHLGVVYRDLGRTDKAREEFERALRQQPDYPPAREALAALTGG
jgi:tetratricopeptide (TPR) repeat protein